MRTKDCPCQVLVSKICSSASTVQLLTRSIKPHFLEPAMSFLSRSGPKSKAPAQAQPEEERLRERFKRTRHDSDDQILFWCDSIQVGERIESLTLVDGSLVYGLRHGSICVRNRAGFKTLDAHSNKQITGLITCGNHVWSADFDGQLFAWEPAHFHMAQSIPFNQHILKLLAVERFLWIIQMSKDNIQSKSVTITIFNSITMDEVDTFEVEVGAGEAVQCVQVGGGHLWIGLLRGGILGIGLDSLQVEHRFPVENRVQDLAIVDDCIYAGVGQTVLVLPLHGGGQKRATLQLNHDNFRCMAVYGRSVLIGTAGTQVSTSGEKIGLYRLLVDEMRIVTASVQVAEGTCIIVDGDIFWVADGREKVIYAFSLNASTAGMQLEERRVLYRLIAEESYGQAFVRTYNELSKSKDGRQVYSMLEPQYRDNPSLLVTDSRKFSKFIGLTAQKLSGLNLLVDRDRELALRYLATITQSSRELEYEDNMIMEMCLYKAFPVFLDHQIEQGKFLFHSTPWPDAWGPYSQPNLKFLGAGAAGKVFEASWEGQTVAVKVPRSGCEFLSPQDRQEWLREITLMAVLRHPNLLQVHAAHFSLGEIFLVLPRATSSLREMLQQNPGLPLERALPIAYGITSGLDFLHTAHFLHRDMKTALTADNVLLVGPEMRPLVMDFGTARMMKSARTFIGTPNYLPPEIAHSGHGGNVPDGAWTRGCDIYSLGCIFYALLTRREPWEQEREVLPTPDARPDFRIKDARYTPAQPDYSAWIEPSTPAQLQLRALIESMWATEVEARPFCYMVLQNLVRIEPSLRPPAFQMPPAWRGWLKFRKVAGTVAVLVAKTSRWERALISVSQAGITYQAWPGFPVLGQIDFVPGESAVQLLPEAAGFQLQRTASGSFEFTGESSARVLSCFDFVSWQLAQRLPPTRIRRVVGNILHVHADGMVVSHDSAFVWSKTKGVQPDLLRAYSGNSKEQAQFLEQLQRQVAQLPQPVQMGAVIITDAGLLPNSKLLHLATIPGRDRTSRVTSDEDMTAAVQAALRTANELRLSTLAMPSIMATEAFRANESEAARAEFIYRVCVDYCARNAHHALREVVLVEYRP